jgi:dTDP-4-dehydrorhamnose reductase
MRIAVTGAAGQLGRALVAVLGGEHDVRGWARADVDVTDAGSVMDAVMATRPDALVHAAAWTDVDGCELDPARAHTINVTGTEHAARAARRAQARLVVVSTDFVFDGRLGRPYTEGDVPNPLQVYGATKREGEQVGLDVAPRCTVVRTAWLHDPAVPAGFTAAILARASAGEPFDVASDQVGSPTTTAWFAARIGEILETHTFGVLHRAEVARESRADFARRFLSSHGFDPGLVVDAATEDLPPRPAKRPRFAPLASVRELHVEHTPGDGCDC